MEHLKRGQPRRAIATEREPCDTVSHQGKEGTFAGSEPNIIFLNVTTAWGNNEP